MKEVGLRKVLGDSDKVLAVLYADRAAVRLLKCLCQTEPCKRLGWHSAAAVGSHYGIPTCVSAHYEGGP